MNFTELPAGVYTYEEDRIAHVVLHNPGKKNALSASMAQSLKEMLPALLESEPIVVMLSGSGNDFCAGADLDPRSVQGGFDVGQFLRSTYNPIVSAMRASDKLFIARVKGACVGAGLNFALACDLVYAAEDARLSQIFTRIGLSSDAGGAYFMRERLGYHRAMEALLFHSLVSGSEAAAQGWINRAFPADRLEEEVRAIAQQLAAGPAQALMRTKANLRAAQNGLDAALESEAQSQSANFKTLDFIEGVMAFYQKRKAQFKGK